MTGDVSVARDLPSERSKAPDFEHWESPETHIRWERGLAIVAGMIGVVFTFFFLVSVLPLSPDNDTEEVRGLQPTVVVGGPAVQPRATASPVATATAQPPPPSEQRVSATSRAFPNVRRGPTLDAAIITNLQQGQRVDVVGRSADNLWLQILNPANSRERLWVSADMLDVTGDARSLPVARPE